MRLEHLTDKAYVYKRFIEKENYIKIKGVFTELLESIVNELDKKVLIIVNSQSDANALSKVFKEALTDTEFGLFPYEVNYVSSLQLFKKKEFLKRLPSSKVVISTINGIFDYLPSEDLIEELRFKKGEKVHLNDIVNKLSSFGFERVYEIENYPSFSIKGSIIDVFSFDYNRAVRIQLDFDTIEKITFLNEALVSEEEVEEVKFTSMKYLSSSEIEEIRKEVENNLLPKDELVRETVEKDLNELSKSGNFGVNFYPQFLANGKFFAYRTLLDYALDRVFILFDLKIDSFLKEFDDFIDKEGKLYGEFINKTSVKDVFDSIGRRKVIEFGHFETNAIDIPIKEIGEDFTLLGNLKQFVLTESKNRIILFKTEFVDRVKEILDAYEIRYKLNLSGEPGVYVEEGFYKSGIETPKIVVFTDRELFFHIEVKKPKKILETKAIISLEELTFGDLVVHRDFGIGIFRGLVKLGDTPKEFLLLEYRDGEKLYVPLERIGFVEKYIGDKRVISLSSLSSNEWAKAKEKARENAKEFAKKLLLIQAKRRIFKRDPYKPFPREEKIIDLSFPYELTDDQIRAIEDVYSDLEIDEPMDRLIIGDVGYGKTEVAVRAALRVVLNRKKVMVLSPTTILALQHERTFKERLRLFPIRIEMLSSLTNTKKEKEILKDLSNGKIDIVIGTHRLLSKDVEAKDLGLLIIDEEQKFGVKHKEKIKELKANLDVLTLSATPIPRTLYTSLIKLRPVSLILTPPEGRIPVKTFVFSYDVEIMKQAVEFELKRGGQVFAVFNNIEKIYGFAEFIKSLTNARVAVIHGKMRKEVIEDVMVDFYEGNVDILVATTIVENGLDIPTVNTLIVINAENFGLTQMYQLRGRIGRSSTQAYAYFFYTNKNLSAIAEERLEAIREFEDIGSGLKIAMKDLELRGAGNILGKEQHGHIVSVGYNMYLSLLDQAIKELQGNVAPPIKEVSVRLNESYYIKDSYVPSNSERILYYRRITQAETLAEIDNIEFELIDKFGYPPHEVKNLLTVGKIMVLGRLVSAKEIYQEGNRVFIVIEQSNKVTVDKLLEVSKIMKNVQFGSYYISFEVSFTLQDVLKMLNLLSEYEKVG
ncbi:MAG: transcription-repair coupling factor [Caldisericaceae bacterium]